MSDRPCVSAAKLTIIPTMPDMTAAFYRMLNQHRCTAVRAPDYSEFLLWHLKKTYSHCHCSVLHSPFMSTASKSLVSINQPAEILFQQVWAVEVVLTVIVGGWNEHYSKKQQRLQLHWISAYCHPDWIQTLNQMLQNNFPLRATQHCFLSNTRPTFLKLNGSYP